MSIVVSIIIPAYNDWQRLSLCIHALSRQTFPLNKFEVIIVNNNPADDVPDQIILPSNFKILNEVKPGSYAARNLGIISSRGTILGFTDSDCIPDEKWIEKAVEYLDLNKSCSRIAGKISIFYSSTRPTTAEIYDKLYAFNQIGYAQNSGTGVTANMFSYKTVFDAIGYFNANLMSGGDFDWGTKAHKKGFQINYVDSIIVNHPARENVNMLIKKERRVGGSQAIFMEKYNNRFLKVLHFVSDLVPRLHELKFIINNTKTLSITDKIRVLFLRQYLLYVRSFERLRVSLGKKPNRE